MKPTMTVKEVARQLRISEQTVRIGLQQGIYPWGYAVKTSTKYTYVINRKQFNEEWKNDQITQVQ